MPLSLVSVRVKKIPMDFPFRSPPVLLPFNFLRSLSLFMQTRQNLRNSVVRKVCLKAEGKAAAAKHMCTCICDRVREKQPCRHFFLLFAGFANISPDRPSLQIWSRYHARQLRYGYFYFGLPKTPFFKTAIFVQVE